MQAVGHGKEGSGSQVVGSSSSRVVVLCTGSSGA